MNKFEVVILLSPETTSQAINDEIKFFKDLITSNTGKIIDEEDWGLRELSYNILKFKKAFYKFFQIDLAFFTNLDLNINNIITFFFHKSLVYHPLVVINFTYIS